ncbi:hypothetical protein MKW92_014844 [Papaver armeniacum]|nr:hypothetical protein MKW92_014844 [Papaver armeniacum]
MVTLCGLLESFENLLCQSQVADKEIEELFARQENLEPLDLLVIDEAAKLKECQSVSDEVDFGRSLFERLGLFGHAEDLLNVQYRMHPEISSFPNRKIYKEQIIDAPRVLCENYQKII